MIIGDIRQLRAVEFRDDELYGRNIHFSISVLNEQEGEHIGIRMCGGAYGVTLA